MTTNRNLLAAAQASGRLEIVHVTNKPSPTEPTTEPAIHVALDPRAAPLQASKALLIKTFAEHGINTLTVEYSGTVGLREITSYLAHDHEGAEVPFDAPPPGMPDLRQSLKAFLFDILDAFHPDFQVDEGGSGTLSFDVSAGSVLLEQTDNVVTYVTSTAEI